MGVALALAGAGWYGYDWWTVGRFMVSTDNAYVGGDIATISPKVSGYIKKVLVANNQHVKAGDPLVTLDDGDYRIAADQAKELGIMRKIDEMMLYWHVTRLVGREHLAAVLGREPPAPRDEAVLPCFR